MQNASRMSIVEEIKLNIIVVLECCCKCVLWNQETFSYTSVGIIAAVQLKLKPKKQNNRQYYMMLKIDLISFEF
jgi:hypothetical protein